MKINISHMEQQFAVISSCVRAIDDLYDELVILGMNGKPGIPYVIQLLAERIKVAYRAAEDDLQELIFAEKDDDGWLEIKLVK